jgi:hypothetical protein
MLQKSKIELPKNLAKVDLWTSLLLPRFQATTEVDRFWMNRYFPHIAAHKAHQRLQEFSISTPKRLLQQYRHIAAPDVYDGTSAVGESRHRIHPLIDRLDLA